MAGTELRQAGGGEAPVTACGAHRGAWSTTVSFPSEFSEQRSGSEPVPRVELRAALTAYVDALPRMVGGVFAWMDETQRYGTTPATPL
jgi:hypothetical protein